MNDIWSLAEQIADFRKGNGLPNGTAREVVHEIEEASCIRLHNDPEYCSASAESKKKPVAWKDRQFASAARVASGASVLVDWLGSGAQPIPIAQAQTRANICLGCPENREGHKWLELTAEIVRTIADQMQAKGDLKLRVDGEERLHSCRVCACPLPLKVHVPLDTILAHTEDDILNAMPHFCWLTIERQTQSL